MREDDRRDPCRVARSPAEWASDGTPTAIEHMGIDHRGAYVGMPQQFLDGSDVITILQ